MVSNALFVIAIALASTLTVLKGSNAAPHHPRASAGLDQGLTKRNWGGHIKDWYLGQMTHNYFCTSGGRLVPVDPETGHMLLRGLRKRGWLDDLLGHSEQTETGLCRNPTWVLAPGWTQPIPVTQFKSQYPFADVNERGQIVLQPDYLEWLEKRAQARQAAGIGANGAAAGGAAAASGVVGANGAVIPDGGVGYIPPSSLNYGAGYGTSSGLGVNNFGNGVAAGSAAHV